MKLSLKSKLHLVGGIYGLGIITKIKYYENKDFIYQRRFKNETEKTTAVPTTQILNSMTLRSTIISIFITILIVRCL